LIPSTIDVSSASHPPRRPLLISATRRLNHGQEIAAKTFASRINPAFLALLKCHLNHLRIVRIRKCSNLIMLRPGRGGTGIENSEQRSAFLRARQSGSQKEIMLHQALRSATMPRYFFNIMEGRSQKLVRDIEGMTLANTSEAGKEALGLAQDITRHGIHQPTQTWSVIVTDESGDEVLTVPLAGVPPRKPPGPFGLGHHIAKLEASLSRGSIVWLIGAAVLAVSVPAITAVRIAQEHGTYQTASAPSEGAFVAVRFVGAANMGDVGKFLSSYKASMAGGPRPGNLYRLRVGDDDLAPEEVAKIASRMAQEPVIEFAAAVQ
jgi:hypothetical protein